MSRYISSQPAAILISVCTHPRFRGTLLEFGNGCGISECNFACCVGCIQLPVCWWRWYSHHSWWALQARHCSSWHQLPRKRCGFASHWPSTSEDGPRLWAWTNLCHPLCYLWFCLDLLGYRFSSFLILFFSFIYFCLFFSDWWDSVASLQSEAKT